MSCRVADASAYYDGDLDDRRRASMEQHFTQCPSCAAVLKSYEGISRQLKSLPVTAPPASLRIRVYSRLDQLERRGSFLSTLGGWWRGLGLISATAVIALVASALLRTYDLRSALFLPSATVTMAAGPSVAATSTNSATLASEATVVAASPRPKPASPVSSPMAANATAVTVASGTKGAPAPPPAPREAGGPAPVAPAGGDPRPPSERDLDRSPSASASSTPPGVVDAERDAEPARDRHEAAEEDRHDDGGDKSPSPAGAPPPIALASADGSKGKPDHAPETAALDCLQPPAHSFGILYQTNKAMRESLGCAVSVAQVITLTEVTSERGYVFARADQDVTYTLADAPATWRSVSSKDGKAPESNHLQSETRGQSGQPAKVADEGGRLDYGGAGQRVFASQLVEFQRGVMLLSDRKVIYVLFSDGSWQDFPDHFPR